MSEPASSTEQILEQMRVAMGRVPPAIEKAARADPRMVAEQARSSAFAMPPEDGALDPETRTLVYLAVALATSNRACTISMADKARMQGIAAPKLLEALHIARFALATQVVGNAEPVFDLVNELVASALPG
ncbi:MAG TPA: carboxymuconolactone decarboxylase family protein [Acidimicrobiales bacterium]|nr:carboxymuconolactone decarboxylase family protein [Acidimicrobiales bacterium]